MLQIVTLFFADNFTIGIQTCHDDNNKKPSENRKTASQPIIDIGDGLKAILKFHPLSTLSLLKRYTSAGFSTAKPISTILKSFLTGDVIHSL